MLYILKGEIMKKIKIFCAIVWISIIISIPVFAIKPPHITRPAVNDVSLQPLVVWNPVQGAISYSVKLKEINTSTGASTTIETGATAASTTSYRPTVTLTAGNFYFIVITAVGNNEQSTKEKLYFQAKDKKLIIGDTEFEGIPPDDDNFITRLIGAGPDISAYTRASGGNFNANVKVILPDGAIITGLKTTWANGATPSVIVLQRQALNVTDNTTVASVTSTNTTPNFITAASTNVDATKTTVDNTTYQYFLFLALANGNGFATAEISYVD